MLISVCQSHNLMQHKPRLTGNAKVRSWEDGLQQFPGQHFDVVLLHGPLTQNKLLHSISVTAPYEHVSFG